MESGLQVKLAIDHQRFSPAFPGFFTPVSYDETDGLFFFFGSMKISLRRTRKRMVWYLLSKRLDLGEDPSENPTWMPQDFTKWLGSMGYNLLVKGVYWGYNL